MFDETNIQRGERMSRTQQALLIDELWDETLHLNEQIADLQARLAQYEDVETSGLDSSTRISARLTTLKAQAHREQAQCKDGLWSDWPYCWAARAFYFLRERFHSFHG